MPLTARQHSNHNMRHSSISEDGTQATSTLKTSKRSGRFRFLCQKNKTTISQNESITSVEDMQPKEVVVPLLRMEEKCYALNGSPVSTLTWFEGDHDAAAYLLQERMRDILAANPWLGGRVTKRSGKPCLVHSEASSNWADTDESGDSSDEESLLKEITSACPPNLMHITDPKETKLHRSVPTEETADLCKAFLVKNGPKHLVWRITIIPCSVAPSKYFAVVDSMSHVVSDGHTYYNIHNMLCANVPIRRLQAERVFGTVQLQKEAIGLEEYGLFDSAGFLIGLVCGVIKSTVLAPMKLAPKIKKRYFLVDTDKIKDKKAAAVKDMVDDNVQFVSTNDVLTSWLFQQTKCSYGLMIMNFRSRLEGHTEDLAGNYENSLFYYPNDFSSPRLIRKSLAANPTSWRRAVTHETTTTPKLMTHIKGHFSMVSNWASFAENSNLPKCQEELHIPLFVRGKHPLPNNLSVGIIFRAGPGKTAMYVVGNSKVMRRLENASIESSDLLQ